MDAKKSWLAECCMEDNIIRGSVRELMCQSVLPTSAATDFHNRDLEPEDDGLAAYVGEDEQLVWTEEGKNSLLGKPGWAVPGELVNDGFLRTQPLTVQEGLRLKFWEIRRAKASGFRARLRRFGKQVTAMASSASRSLHAGLRRLKFWETPKASSLIHAHATTPGDKDDICNQELFMNTCKEDMRLGYLETCKISAQWKVFNGSSQRLSHFLTHAADLDSPSECASMGPIVAFKFHPSAVAKNLGKSIKCHHLTDKRGKMKEYVLNTLNTLWDVSEDVGNLLDVVYVKVT